MSVYRDTLLRVAAWPPLARFARARGMRMGVTRFVAGETLEDGLRVARTLHEQGRYAILDLLGEFVTTEEAAHAMADGIVDAVRGLATVPGERQLALKPTQLGLGLSTDLALEAMRRIATEAAAARVDVCMDMENHPYVDATLHLLATLHAEGHHHVTTVVQAYLHRTPDDLRRLLAMDPVPTLRWVKGAYAEPASVARVHKTDVDRAYLDGIDVLLGGGGTVHVASHDERMIRHAQARRDALGVPKERVTFQMLYGVTPQLQARLAGEGERVGVYLPYGRDWYGYFSRRLAERPANVLFVLRGLMG